MSNISQIKTHENIFGRQNLGQTSKNQVQN